MRSGLFYPCICLLLLILIILWISTYRPLKSASLELYTRNNATQGSGHDPASWSVVCPHYNENLDWILSLPSTVSIHLYDCGVDNISDAIRSLSNVYVHDKTGDLAKTELFYAYYKFCSDYYDKLPKHILFMHGHDTGWHQKFTISEIYTKCKQIVEDKSVEYMNLSDEIFDDWVTDTGGFMMSLFAHNWTKIKDYIEDVNDGSPSSIVEINGGQCYVDRNRIHRKSKQYWTKLSNFMSGVQYKSDLGYTMEGANHFVFGESWVREYLKQNLERMRRESKNELELRLCAVMKI